MTGMAIKEWVLAMFIGVNPMSMYQETFESERACQSKAEQLRITIRARADYTQFCQTDHPDGGCKLKCLTSVSAGQ